MRESRKRRRTNWVKRSSGAGGSKRKKEGCGEDEKNQEKEGFRGLVIIRDDEKASFGQSKWKILAFYFKLFIIMNSKKYDTKFPQKDE